MSDIYESFSDFCIGRKCEECIFEHTDNDRECACLYSYDKGRADEHELALALADRLLNTEWGYCFTCENHMKNITIDGVNNGCDGSCSHNKEYSAEEFLEMFKARFEFEKKYKAEQIKDQKGNE